MIKSISTSIQIRNNLQLHSQLPIRKVSSFSNSRSVSFQGISDIFQRSRKENIDFKQYFDETKDVQSYIWDLKAGHIVNNPEAKEKLRILDNLDRKQQKEFVKTFCEETGFPNLNLIKQNIDNEIKRAANLVSRAAGYTPLFLAYTSACSVGRETALPGSDCDGLFLVVDKDIDYFKINNGLLGHEINQRIVETTGAHYPELHSIQTMMHYVEMADRIFEKMKTPEKIEEYKKNIQLNGLDFMKAGEFNVDLASKLDNDNDKNMMYLTAMFVEELRAGSILINNIDAKTLRRIKVSSLYKYSNALRQEGFKENTKAKWENRKQMCKNFYKMNPKQQFKICSEIFKSSLGVYEEKRSDCYADFDIGNMLEFIRTITTFPV